MRRLEGKRVVLTGSRKTEELGQIVEKLGGIPLVRPAQGTVFLADSDLEADIQRMVREGVDWIILTTGIGTETIFTAARNIGLENELLQVFRQAQIAARGYKTVNMLKKLGLQPAVRDDDGSTSGLLRELAPHDLKGRRAVLQLHGDPAPKLVQWLAEQGADYYEILPYRHVPPDPHMIEQLLSEMLQGEVDAVTFTSSPQVRFIMEYAKEKGLQQSVLKAFAGDVVAAAVGKVTAQFLREEGIERVVVPEEERMGSMIVALAKYYAEQETN